jgi:hypothetical protein
MRSRIAALSASTAAISSSIAAGSRNAASSALFGFFTDRSEVAASIAAPSTFHEFAESAADG